MQTLEIKRPWWRGWVIGLALLSLLVPTVAVFLRQEPATSSAHPEQLTYYRQMVAALVLGMISAAGALVGNWALTPAWLRWLSVFLAILGLLISAYSLWTLIGTCGAQVLWEVCAP